MLDFRLCKFTRKLQILQCFDIGYACFVTNTYTLIVHNTYNQFVYKYYSFSKEAVTAVKWSFLVTYSTHVKDQNYTTKIFAKGNFCRFGYKCDLIFGKHAELSHIEFREILILEVWLLRTIQSLKQLFNYVMCIDKLSFINSYMVNLQLATCWISCIFDSFLRCALISGQHSKGVGGTKGEKHTCTVYTV